MRIGQVITVLSWCIMFASCNTPEKNVVSLNAKADSTLLPGEVDAGLLAKFKTVNGLPYTANTMLMFHMETCDSLGTNEVKQLATRQPGSHSAWDESSEDYLLKDFYTIDSIKASGNYSAWCDSLQPGMTKSSNAYAVGRIVVNDTMQILLWGLVTSSYEACPVTATQNVYMSILNKDMVIQTCMLSEYITSADPPVAMERIVTGTINKDLTFEMNFYQENDEDMDLPDLTVTRAYYKFSLKNGTITKISEKKEMPVKIKRKASATS